VSDVLGLADVVFPAMLAGWSLRYDITRRNSFEDQKSSARQVIESNLVRVADREKDRAVEARAGGEKKGLIDTVLGFFRKAEPESDQQEISKEKEREQNIIVILEEEKVAILQTKLSVINKNSVFRSSLAGYGIGCFLCEVFQTGQGQPALLFIVPSMFFTVFASGVLRGELDDMWAFDPDSNSKDKNDAEKR
jgi:Signal peptide peptidase